MDTIKQVTKILSYRLGMDITDIHQGSTLEDLGADSLDEMEALIALEEEFGIEFNDDDWDRFETVDDIAEYIDRYRD